MTGVPVYLLVIPCMFGIVSMAFALLIAYEYRENLDKTIFGLILLLVIVGLLCFKMCCCMVKGVLF